LRSTAGRYDSGTNVASLVGVGLSTASGDTEAPGCGADTERAANRSMDSNDAITSK
jgi:hypothetical protein